MLSSPLIWLMLFVGGGSGALSRVVLTQLVTRWVSSESYLAVFVVNLIGSLLMGSLLAVTEKYGSQHLRLIAGTGFLGGFTTFSSFILDAYLLTAEKSVWHAFGYIAASVSFSAVLFLVAYKSLLMILR